MNIYIWWTTHPNNEDASVVMLWRSVGNFPIFIRLEFVETLNFYAELSLKNEL